MTELDRFTQFLIREAAAYNAPPETPAASMWERIEVALAETAEARSPLRDVLASPVYHEPPATPREEMWSRIEASLALRRSAPPAAREAGLDALDDVESDESPARERRAVALWITGLAVAASLVVGVALGRGTLLLPGGETGLASGMPETAGPGPMAAAAQPVEVAVTEELPGTVSQPLESAAPLEPAVAVLRADAAGPGDESSLPVASRTQSDRRRVAARYATSEHLGRAATLLTAFRTDASESEGQGEIAGWARDLLGDTRLLLDMDVTRSPQERGLLEDLELVLAQIARLGPGAPHFERDLIHEGMERQGTLTRLRSAAVQGT